MDIFKGAGSTANNFNEARGNADLGSNASSDPYNT
jgi:hypothetical protein